MIFACQFGWNRLTRLPFWMAPTGDIFPQKIKEMFKDLPNVFGIADDNLTVGYDSDGRYHDRTLREVMQIYH